MCGIADNRVQDRFLREAKLTYREALEMALAAETAVRDSHKLRAGGDDNGAPHTVVTHREETRVDQIRRDRTTRSRPTRRPQGGTPTANREPECHRCGGKHDPSRCRFKDYECHYCKKRGHLALVCRKKKQSANLQRTEQAHRVEVAPSRQEEEEYTMYRATVNGGNGKWKRKRKVETENGNGKRKREMVVTAIRTQYKLSMPDRSSSSKSRSASLGRCKTWTLDSGTHELTGIWTPDKAINDDT